MLIEQKNQSKVKFDNEGTLKEKDKRQVQWDKVNYWFVCNK